MKHLKIQNILSPALAPYYLPDLLNKLGITAENFAAGRLLVKPAMLRALLMDPTAGLGITAHERRRLRNLKFGNPPYAAGQAMLSLFDSTVSKRLSSRVRELAATARLYDSPEGVKSEIVGAFTFDGDDAQEAFMKVFCGACGKSEVVLADTVEDAMELVTKFTYLSGPYCRCHGCQKVVRPEVTETQGTSEFHDFSMAWDDYLACLQDCLEQMERHLGGLGIPAPAGLHLEISNANWRGSSATANCGLTGEELAKTLRTNSDFSVTEGQLRITPNGLVTMTCCLNDHDASRGVTIMPFWDCELFEGEPQIFQQDLAEAAVYAAVASRLLTGREAEYQYTPGAVFGYVSHSSLAEGIRDLAKALGTELTPDAINELMLNPSDNPQLDLIIFSLFMLEDMCLMRKVPANVVDVNAAFIDRALRDYLVMENSDAT